MNGRQLYELWCESLTSDQAKYYGLMNPARVKLTWPGSEFVDHMHAVAQTRGRND